LLVVGLSHFAAHHISINFANKSRIGLLGTSLAS
jgi:hypothetical protein